ncbi:MAG: hypothetical protein JKY15_07550 [Deltaproteobacteria bacterium]|nr:hypothetical protein [Deltaproteobacteria bacterium]
MDLEKVTARIRPRRGWEAIDLGITLVQHHAKTLYKVWFAISLPIFVLLVVLLNTSPWLMIFSFWWLLPILERPLLYLLSRELFGEGLTARQCIKSFYSVGKIQWFASLTWRRISFTRSFDLPLIQLEGVKGAERSKRLRVIHSGDSGSAVWLTVVFVLVEFIIYLSIVTLIYLLVPEVYLQNFDLWEWMTADTDSKFVAQVFNFLIYLAISLVAPFYVACGFALYLNQRTHLEAWDIELSFKRLAAKLAEKSSNVKVRLASYASIGLLLAAVGVFNPQQAIAETDFSRITVSNAENKLDIQDKLSENEQLDLHNLSHSEARNLIKAIKEGEDFHQVEIQETTRYRESTDWDLDDSDQKISSGWLIFAKIFAVLIEFALWIFIAVIIIFLILKYKRLLVRGVSNKKVEKKRPVKLFGLDLETQSLPDKPWLVARQLIENQRYREALSLLYRASLIWYIDNSDALIKEGYTELECLAQISKRVNNTSQQYLISLTNSWRSLAYAHQVPKERDLIELCDNWPRIMKTSIANDSDVGNSAKAKRTKVNNEK